RTTTGTGHRRTTTTPGATGSLMDAATSDVLTIGPPTVPGAV
ncbi:MAG: hypothetical protein QOE59_3747, partial [Actinomycetota bacterium]|nr:hypothetical protein [Actinomycetota bacterium]